ncbi:EF-hand domain-containing protein [Streptomyces sp. BR123]|uniref:EF-hand domain-containing protein n=1 Tax=Streptomyces sp. BR123 TaxID=2749828 RepID=UPI0015C4B90C|nr:EF-hand domain-containing protein [Streptomyces sp. BR123]NXY95365.1 EF-hand domain-containing protein [Streptomyces sp. BR123]
MSVKKAAVADEIFDRLDTNGDGVVSAEDYRASAEQFLQSYGMGPHSPKGRALIEANEALWERQAELVDHDRDGRIDRQEYREWFDSLPASEAASGAPSGSAEVMAVLHAQFTVADRDGDGLMDLHDFTVWREVKGVPGRDATAAFELIDSDGDGSIGWQDFTGAAAAHGLEALLYGPGRT